MSRAKTNLAFYITRTVFLVLFLPFVATAAIQDVIFNEIAWMGKSSPGSSNDEWIELYNNTSQDINLSGWQIIAADNTPKILLNGLIPAKGFYLLERSDDQTVSEVAASQIYTGALGNSGEDLNLIDENSALIDEVKADNGWPAGDNSTKQTMQRTSLLTWNTSIEINGTPGKENSPNPGFLPQASATVLPEPFGKVIFSEIMPSPEGADQEQEWLEIFNQNDFLIDLSGWQIKDSFGKTDAYTFPANNLLGPNAYLVIKKPDLKITLNDQEEKLMLFTASEKLIDSTGYIAALPNQSWAKFGNDWGWTNKLTPGNANIKGEQKQAQDNTPVTAGLLSNIIERKENDSPFWQTLTIAFAIAALSGIAVLMLKRLMADSKNN